MRRQKYTSIGWLPIVIHVVLTVVVIFAGMKWLPMWHRHGMIRKLVDSDLAQRERALNYVIRHARLDDAVRIGAIDRLGVSDDTNFLHIVNALDRAGVWERPTIAVEPWLRWLNILCHDPNIAARVNAAYLIGELPQWVDNVQLPEMLGRLLTDPDKEVRYRALVTAGQLSGIATDRKKYETLIVRATGDDDSEVARHAWIMLGLLKPTSGVVANWRDQEPEVAQAVLWAATYTNQDQPQSAIEAIKDTDVAFAIRAVGVYCLSLSDSDMAHQTLVELIKSHVQSTSTENRLLAWRSVLALSQSSGTDGHERETLAEELASVDPRRYKEPIADPVVLSLLYRDLLPNDWLLESNSLGDDSQQPWQPLALLAVLEGLQKNQHTITVDPNAPAMLRLAATAVMRQPDPSYLQDLFASEVSAIRDLACLVAMDRFSPKQLSTLIQSLLADFNDNAKCAGAILAGWSGLEGKLLLKKERDEDIWSVQQIMRLGLWMQGSRPEMTQRVSGLLTRDDLPRTTVLLAILHHDHAQAFEYLFNPEGPPPLDLIDLLDRFRWWRVLDTFLPDSAPPFWIWADRELQQLQIDVLRDWYILNRFAIQRMPESDIEE